MHPAAARLPLAASDKTETVESATPVKRVGLEIYA
jgi:hypothetical protein